MKLIAAVDSNWGIGNNGQLLFHAKADMVNFKNVTTGGVVIMGRKTLLTMPKCRPLPNRTNIIMTKNDKFVCEDAIICHNKSEAISYINSHYNDKVFVIGGTSIYDLFLDECDEAIITKFYSTAADVDAYLHNLDTDPNWALVEESEPITEGELSFAFCKYKRL